MKSVYPGAQNIGLNVINNDLEEKLLNCNIDDIPEFSLQGLRTLGKIVDVYDGDTCKIILANGDITTGNATLTANLVAGNVKTDNLLHADGTPWDFLLAGGSATQIQYNTTIFDTNNCYNPTSQPLILNGITVPPFSWAPNIPGYYLVTGAVLYSANATTGAYNATAIFKNGTNYA